VVFSGGKQTGNV